MNRFETKTQVISVADFSIWNLERLMMYEAESKQIPAARADGLGTWGDGRWRKMRS